MKKRQSPLFAALALLTAGAVCAPGASGYDFDFDTLVGQVERHYGKRRLSIPFLGLATFLGSGVATPFGANSLKVAVIEDIDHAGGAFEPRLSQGWRPVVRVRRRGEEDVAIFGRDEGKWVKLLTLVQEGDQAVVTQLRMRPSALLEFIARKARE